MKIFNWIMTLTVAFLLIMTWTVPDFSMAERTLWSLFDGLLIYKYYKVI